MLEGSASRAKELCTAFAKMARDDRRMDVAAHVQEGGWNKTKSHRKKRSMGSVCVRDADGRLHDASKKAELFKIKLESESRARRSSPEQVIQKTCRYP